MLTAAAIGASALMAAPAFAETRSPAALQHQITPVNDSHENPWWVLGWALKKWDRWEDWSRWDNQWYKLYLWKNQMDHDDDDQSEYDN
jgi:hypothetical protein